MKIGILTFHRAINYGAFLQCFALKKHIESLGHTVVIVDYWPKHHADPYSFFYCPSTASFLGKVKSLVYALIKFPRAYLRKKRMEGMFEEYFCLTKKAVYLKPESLENIGLDCVVYGSDQIWSNSIISGYRKFDEAFWGRYIPLQTRKVAYAPSMGVIDISDDEQMRIRDLLKNFSFLSTRETMLRDAIRHLTNKNIHVVVDPVFLLGKDIWEEFIRPVPKGRYVLFYNIMKSREARDFAEHISKRIGCKVIEITGRVDPFKFGSAYLQTADAFDFISYVKNAEFVVSTSFHGTAFSILFEKQFFALGMQNNSGRVASLLGLLGIEERLVLDTSVNTLTKIDYSCVTPKLLKLIAGSSSYLQEAVFDENI